MSQINPLDVLALTLMCVVVGTATVCGAVGLFLAVHKWTLKHL